MASRACLALLASLSLCQCTREESPPVVGTLRTVEHDFVLHAGETETLYTVRDRSGREIARLMPAGELAAKHPGLSENLKDLYWGTRILASPFRFPTDGEPPFFDSPEPARDVPSSLPPLPDLRPPPADEP